MFVLTSAPNRSDRFVHAQTHTHSIEYNRFSPIPIVAVFTKYDVLVESLKPPDEVDSYRDIEKEIEILDRSIIWT